MKYSPENEETINETNIIHPSQEFLSLYLLTLSGVRGLKMFC